MIDEFVEFRFPVSLEDRQYFSELTSLMDDYFGDFEEAIRTFRGNDEIYSERISEDHRHFRGTFTDWAELCTRLSILEKQNPNSRGDGKPVYEQKRGLEGHYRESVQRVFGQSYIVETLFSMYDALSTARNELRNQLLRQEKDDLPF
ncbi:hypothetical protein HY500_00015 [Candidatus Woesearchaeota archaeon]|nr:hypothetical protein [Candidatus Woesearchaeota archaeon]